jgi:hypothetical protein
MMTRWKNAAARAATRQKYWAAEDIKWDEDESDEMQQVAIQPLQLGQFPKLRCRKRVVVIDGFSLHADTAVQGNDRQGIERLCHYGARSPMSESRLRKLSDGRYECTPKKGIHSRLPQFH